MTPLAPVVAAAATMAAAALPRGPRARAALLSTGLAAAALLAAAASRAAPGVGGLCLRGYSFAVLAAAALLAPLGGLLDRYTAALAAAAAMGGFAALGSGGLVGAALGVEASSVAAAALLARRGGPGAALRYYFSAALAGPLLFLAAGVAYMASGSAAYGSLGAGGAAVAAAALAVAGLGVEAGLAPFHAWVPGVFEDSDWVAVAVLLLLVDTPAELLLVRIASSSAAAVPVLLVLGSLSVAAPQAPRAQQRQPRRLLGYLAVADAGLVAVAAAAAWLAGSAAAPVLLVVSGRVVAAGLAASLGLEEGWGLLAAAYALMLLGAPPGPELPAKLAVLRSLYSASPLLAAWEAVLMLLPAGFLVPALLRWTRRRWRRAAALALAPYTVLVVLLFACPWLVAGHAP